MEETEVVCYKDDKNPCDNGTVLYFDYTHVESWLYHCAAFERHGTGEKLVEGH